MATKFNMSPLKNPMPAQDPDVRNGNFEEVALGYTAEMAIDEAKRCIGCKNRPCVAACPVNIKIPEFDGVKYIKALLKTINKVLDAEK